MRKAWAKLRQLHGPSLAMAILPALPQLAEYLSPDHTPLQERGSDHCSLSMCQEERELSVKDSKPLCPISNIWYVSSGYSRHLCRSEDSNQYSFPLRVPDIVSQSFRSFPLSSSLIGPDLVSLFTDIYFVNACPKPFLPACPVILDTFYLSNNVTTVAPLCKILSCATLGHMMCCSMRTSGQT